MIFMDSCIFLSVILVLILNPFRIESLNLSESEDLELEKQLKLLNKPAIKTINTKYGDIYDCVDFYKQPAFDHPRLKNFTFEKSTLLRIQKRGKLSSENNHDGLALEDGGCPLGTVPIKRITKEDLIREKSASKLIQSFTVVEPNIPQRRPEIPPEIYKRYAIARVKVSWIKYTGLSANISIHNPQCVDSQFSAARLKMVNGPDSIEAGLRVDPTLFGDTMTRLYIRTDAGSTHCYNLRCAGFVSTSSQTPIETSITLISKPGGPIYEIAFSILRANDNGGRYILQVGKNYEPIGFWPANLFTSPGGLAETASELSWGGEVYSDPETPKPPMGAGDFPKGDASYSAFFSGMLERVEYGDQYYPGGVEVIADNKHYQVKDEGDTKTPSGYLIFYGGPGGSI